MNNQTNITLSPDTPLRQMFAWEAVQLLMAGMFYVMRSLAGTSLRRAQRSAQRDEACRWREIIRQAELIIETHYNNIEKYKNWAGQGAQSQKSRLTRLRLTPAHLTKTQSDMRDDLAKCAMALCQNLDDYAGSVPPLQTKPRDTAPAFAPP